MQLIRAVSVCMRIKPAAAGTQNITLVAASSGVGIAVGKLSGHGEGLEALEGLRSVMHLHPLRS
jgi:hypothetical protein